MSVLTLALTRQCGARVSGETMGPRNGHLDVISILSPVVLLEFSGKWFCESYDEALAV